MVRFETNVSLKNHTTFKIGGRAKYFFKATTKEDLISALKTAKKMRLPFFVLGEGSNILVADKGFPGLVIKLNTSSYKFNANKLYVEAGVPFNTLVREAGKRGLSGLEWAGGLPGTLGGAVFGNAGAFGGETKDSVIWVETLDKNFRVKKFTKKECRFSYRSSIFKKRGWIVLSAAFLLKKGNKKFIQAVAFSHIKYRKERHPLEYPNAGSIFKNCDVRYVPKKVINMFKTVIKTDPFPVIPTAALIAKVPGLMGTRIGKAQISTKHPNFIVNLGGAKAKDVMRLIKLVKQKVKNKFGVKLEEEIKFL